VLTKRKKTMRGFGLIELLITISLLGILTTLAVDNFGAWIQDTKTRSVAESLQNGIRLAQTEAIKSSQSTTFTLTGRNWVIALIPRASTSTTISSTTTIHNGGIPDANFVNIDAANNTSLNFNSMGRLVSPTTNVNYIITNTRGNRRMQVSVNMAGKVRMCDPDKTLSATSPDGVDSNGNC
jgi:type IV fimbrial biogenesis protein FimT